MPSFHCITYGCQMNVNDSAWVARSLVKMGWKETSMETADFVFMNTCSVREKPQHKVLSMLGIIRDVNPRASVAVAGCVAQQLGEKLWEKNSHVRLVLGSDGIVYAPQAFEKISKNPKLRLSYLKFTKEFPDREPELDFFKNIPLLPTGSSEESTKGNDTRAFVNIMQGCNNFCAYCIVPYTRGRQKSRPAASILQECQEWLDRGICDLTLLGQNVNAYGKDKASDTPHFVELLYEVAKLKGLKRLHLVTPHPRDFCDATVNAYKELNVLAPRIHLPLQAGSNAVLEKMGRGYTNQDFMRLVEKLRLARPDIALSSDLIVGFPGETEQDFQETLRIMKEANFIASFSFIYSDRPGTRASKMQDKVLPKAGFDRLNRLMTLQNELGEKWLQSRVGMKTEVLLEAKSAKPKYSEITDSSINIETVKNVTETLDDDAENTSWQGHDVWGNTVNLIIPNQLAYKAGDIVPAKIITAKKHSLLGELIQN